MMMLLLMLMLWNDWKRFDGDEHDDDDVSFVWHSRVEWHVQRHGASW